MINVPSIKSTRLYAEFKAHPYAFTCAIALLAFGIASGISTNAIVINGDIITTVLGQGVGGQFNFWSGFLRSALFNIFIFCLLASAVFVRPLIPLSAFAITLKGFVIGFTSNQFTIEYGWLGAAYFMLLVVLPALCVVCGMALCFARASSNIYIAAISTETVERTQSKAKKKDIVDMKPFLRESLPVLMGIITEGVLSQLAMILLCGWAG